MMAMMPRPKKVPTIGKEIGERARLLAHRLGLSQGQVAANAGLSQPTVSALFNGGTLDPPVGTVMKIARVLEVPLDQLLGITPLPQEPQAPVDADTRLGKLESQMEQLTVLLRNTVGRQEVLLEDNIRKESPVDTYRRGKKTGT